MLHLHLSNRAENLFQALSTVMVEPLRDIFQPEIIVVEEIGMARWLSQRLAEQHGIAANIEFPLPAGFVWRLINGQIEGGAAEAGFSKSTLLWYGMALLPALRERPEFEPIRRYLSGSDEETKIYQLSRQIADLFDQYLVYRPDMIRRWEAGEERHWQAQLWRAMREISTESHWAGLLEEFKQSLASHGFRAKRVPERLSLFAISALSPGYIELLARIAEHIDIHLFVINPSVNYWGDIVSEQDLARLRDKWRRTGRPDVSDLYTVGNPLLASMGKPCRDFLDQWHDHPLEEFEYFEAPDDGTLLSHIQGDILHLQARGGEDIPPLTLPMDESLQLHACHSPMREVQVLHDRLLKLFDSRADLKPHEIVVMAPDIGAYAPCIESVFGAAPPERSIPYDVASLSLTRQPVVETLLEWLLLPDDRFEAPGVIGWLEIPAIRSRFGLDHESVERIRQWVDASGIRWGLDAQHKAELGLPANEHNTWAFGFKRMFLGYAMPGDAELFHGVAPFSDIEGSEAVWLGQLREFVEQLAHWRRELATPVTLAQWQGRINRLIEQFFLPDQDEELFLNNVREQVARMMSNAETASFTGVVSGSIVQQHLSSLLASAGSSYRLLGGRVTFCNMVPVRSIPFRVVCLLGMNDGEFPRNQRPLGFDLIAQQPRKGDRSLREDDRYLFLESLLAARDVLHISYVGRSQQDNSEWLPSVVVAELLDYIEQGYRLAKGELRSALLIEHPLQPFSWRNFTAGSYAAEWLEREREQPEIFAAALPEEAHAGSAESLTIEALIQFLANPSRHFLEQVLGVHCAEYDEALAENERFDLNGLDAYAIKGAMLTDLLSGKRRDGHFELFLARGELPHGGLGRYCFDETVKGLSDFVTVVNESLKGRAEVIDIDLEVAGLSLTGRLTSVFDGRFVSYRPADLKPKDKLALWVAHLARCASGNTGESLHLGSDGTFALQPVVPGEALAHLERLIALYRQGRRSPLPLFLKSSTAYVERLLKGGDEQASLAAARNKWQSSEYGTGDDQDPWIAQAFRDADPLDESFAQLARDVWEPILRQSV